MDEILILPIAILNGVFGTAQTSLAEQWSETYRCAHAVPFADFRPVEPLSLATPAVVLTVRHWFQSAILR